MEQTAARGPRRETERLLLRPRGPGDAAAMHQLWRERDPRVPVHRRLDADGRPNVTDLAEQLRAEPPITRTGLWAIEVAGEFVGYAGIVEATTGPELAFELLRRHQGQGYATEAGRAMLDWARDLGYEELGATVWSWNGASRRVLAKLGFRETGDVVATGEHGDSLVTRWQPGR